MNMQQRLSEQAGIKYNNGHNTVTYFGGLLCHAGDLRQWVCEQTADFPKESGGQK